MTYTVSSGVTCYAIPKASWDAVRLDDVVIYVVKESLSFNREHVVCDPDQTGAESPWSPYAMAGWYGFLKAGVWVILVRRTQVKET